MANNAELRKRMAEIQGEVATEREWWEKKREGIQKEFMKELETESVASSKSKVSDDEAVLVEAGGPVEQANEGGKKKKKKGKN